MLARGWWPEPAVKAEQPLWSEAEVWMVECLPGIGPVTAPAWAKTLRKDGPTALPAPAAARAEAWFAPGLSSLLSRDGRPETP